MTPPRAPKSRASHMLAYRARGKLHLISETACVTRLAADHQLEIRMRNGQAEPGERVVRITEYPPPPKDP